jgi:hypothetical protein
MAGSWVTGRQGCGWTFKVSAWNFTLREEANKHKRESLDSYMRKAAGYRLLSTNEQHTRHI